MEDSAGHRRRRDLSGTRLIRAWLLNLTFYPLMALWIVVSFLGAPICLPFLKLRRGWSWGRAMRFLVTVHGHGLIVIVSPFVSFRGEDLDRIERPCIMVVNHLSFFDSYFMAALPFNDIIFAVGAWPFRMYWYTMFMRLAQYLDVENNRWEDVIRTSKDSFAKSGTVLFFPEGHRSKTGELQPFYSGAFKLSKETGVPIVPLCITGTETMLPPGQWFLHPTRVILKALPPVYPDEFEGSSSHLKMRREVRDRIARTLEELQGEPC